MYVARLVAGMALLLVISLVGSCNELKFALSGKVTTARIFKTYDATNDGVVSHVVMYRFVDDAGEEQKEGFLEDPAGTFPLGSTVRVEYIRRRSRLVGQRELIWPVILASSLTIGALASIPLVIDARRGSRELAHSRAKYKV